MKILFCNITYMNKYIGITEDDVPVKGGAWVEKNNDAHEQWNFLNVDGTCYGFVMNKGNQFAIERIDKSASKASAVEDVTVVWCALNRLGETVIVGWYEHAIVYRYFCDSVITPIYGVDRMYFCEANADDCYLLPENKRVFKIGRASRDGSGRGFGQQNYWYAESNYARNELIPNVVSFLDAHRKYRINRIGINFEDTKNCTPLSEVENARANELFSNGEYFEFLPYGYRDFYSTKTADAAYDVAIALSALHQYNSSIEWHKKVVEIEGEIWDNVSFLPYLYQQREMYKEAVDSAINLLKFENAQGDETRHEIYGIIAESLFYQDKVTEAIEWLDKIIKESKNDELIQHTVSVRSVWSKQQSLSLC